MGGQRRLTLFKYLACAAAAIFSFAPSTHAESFDELSQKANAARSDGRLVEAIGLYRDALAINDTWTEGWWSLGSCLYATHQYADAVQAFAKLTTLSPLTPAGWALKGLSELQTGDNVSALSDIGQALSLGGDKLPQFADVLRTNQALLLNVFGKYEQSLRILASFAQGDPSPVLLDALGLAGLRRPLLPSQIPAQDHAVISAAGRAVFSMLAHSADAGQQFQKLVADFSSVAGVHYLYGYYLFGIDPARAADEFRRELQISPGNAAADAMLAYTLLLGGDAKAALPVAQDAATRDPNSASAQYVLGRVFVKLRDYDSGVSSLEKSVQLDPENLESRISLAGAYALAGRHKDASRERREALRLDTGSSSN